MRNTSFLNKQPSTSWCLHKNFIQFSTRKSDFHNFSWSQNSCWKKFHCGVHVKVLRLCNLC